MVHRRSGLKLFVCPAPACPLVGCPHAEPHPNRSREHPYTSTPCPMRGRAGQRIGALCREDEKQL